MIGGVIGVSAGRLITFDTRGIDFSMVALFIVILVDQLREAKNRKKNKKRERESCFDLSYHLKEPVFFIKAKWSS